MTGIGVTRVQRDVLAMIRRRAAMGMLAPTYREFRQAMGLRTNSRIAAILASLEARGHIRRIYNRDRAIEPTRPAAVQYFAMQRIDGEARLVPLDQVRVGRDDGADILPVDSPGASASGGFSGGEA